ncbi:MAG: YitT family protein [Firmicutes bacterium]|nr:YitT family protein [Bacillota bacterium]
MKKTLSEIRSVAVILLGNLLYAVAVHFFLVSADLATGGVTGISIALGEITPLAVSTYAFILNTVMWFLGLFLLGKHFAAATLLSTFSFPVFLRFLETCFPGGALTDDRLLCTVFGGILIGIGLGITIRQDASTGGIDVVPLALNKYFRLPISTMMWLIDILILLAQILVFPTESLLYGIINIIIYSVVLDKVLVFGKSHIEVKVVSKESRRIADAILHQMDRGCTMLHAEGGYTGEQTQVVLSILSTRELAKVHKLIDSIDDNALVVVSRVSEISGRGFTLEKIHR